MSMTYSSLIASKGNAGSIANWVGYSKLDLPTIVDEAQALIYQMLRVREMRDEWVFGMAVGQAHISLPSRFLDPIGRLYDITNSIKYPQKIETDIQEDRSYQPLSGTLGTDPFTTTSGSTLVSVHDVGHGLTQDSTFTVLGASAVAGLTLNGTFPVYSITDANNFIIDNGSDTAASASTAGGGSAVTYTANVLISGTPSRWTIWKERVKFDTAFDTATQFKQLYYRSPKLLAATTNESNWLVSRYPQLMRKACQTAAADFMKDDGEYQKGLTALQGLIQSTAVENDLIYRGAEFGTDTP